MPGNAFIRFGLDASFSKTIEGESTHVTNKGTSGWIEISDWNWDIEAETSYLKGAGASVGKPQPGTLSFSHYYDKSSPTIMTKIVQGKHFPKVQIVMLKQTGAPDGQGEPYFGITMDEAFVTKVASKGAEDGTVTQDVDMVFKVVAVGYKPQELTGGKLAAQMNFGWDIGRMETEGVNNAVLDAK